MLLGWKEENGIIQNNSEKARPSPKFELGSTFAVTHYCIKLLLPDNCHSPLTIKGNLLLTEWFSLQDRDSNVDLVINSQELWSLDHEVDIFTTKYNVTDKNINYLLCSFRFKQYLNVSYVGKYATLRSFFHDVRWIGSNMWSVQVDLSFHYKGREHSMGYVTTVQP